MPFGRLEIPEFVCDFPEEVMCVADLARLFGDFEAFLTMEACAFEIVGLKIAIAQIDVRLGHRHRANDHRQRCEDRVEAILNQACLKPR